MLNASLRILIRSEFGNRKPNLGRKMIKADIFAQILHYYCIYIQFFSTVKSRFCASKNICKYRLK